MNKSFIKQQINLDYFFLLAILKNQILLDF